MDDWKSQRIAAPHPDEAISCFRGMMFQLKMARATGHQVRVPSENSWLHRIAAGGEYADDIGPTNITYRDIICFWQGELPRNHE